MPRGLWNGHSMPPMVCCTGREDPLPLGVRKRLVRVAPTNKRHWPLGGETSLPASCGGRENGPTVPAVTGFYMDRRWLLDCVGTGVSLLVSTPPLPKLTILTGELQQITTWDQQLPNHRRIAHPRSAPSYRLDTTLGSSKIAHGSCGTVRRTQWLLAGPRASDPCSFVSVNSYPWHFCLSLRLRHWQGHPSHDSPLRARVIRLVPRCCICSLLSHFSWIICFALLLSAFFPALVSAHPIPGLATPSGTITSRFTANRRTPSFYL